MPRAVDFFSRSLGVSQVRQHRKGERIIDRQELVRCFRVVAHVVDDDGGAQQPGHFPQMDLENALPTLHDMEVHRMQSACGV